MKQSILYFLLFISSVISQYDTSSVYVLQKEDFYTPCSYSTSQSKIILGNDIFNGVKLLDGVSFVQEVMITSWYYLKGMNQLSYPLITLILDNQILLQVSYNIFQLKMMYTYKGINANFNCLNLIINKWHYLKLQVILSTSIYNQDVISIRMHTLKDTYCEQIQQYPYSALTSTTFLRGTFKVHLGTDSIFGYLPSCSIMRYVVIYMSPQPWDDSLISIYHDKMAVNTYLYWHYDIFYTNKSGGYLLSQGQDMNKNHLDYLTSNDIKYIGSTFFLELNAVNQVEETGFTLYFEFRILDVILAGSKEIICTIQSLNDGIITLLFVNNLNDVYYQYRSSETLLGIKAFKDQWLQVVIIYDLFSSLKIQVFINSSITQLSFSTILSASLVSSFFYIIFASPASHIPIEVEFYYGTFLSKTNTCFLQIGRELPHCLICENSYYLSYQEGMICKSSGNRFNKGLILDWDRSECDPFMMYLNISNTCSCRSQSYKLDNQCYQCPQYCDECDGSNQCKAVAENRNILTGKCYDGYFDEDYYCISSAYQIKHKINFFSIVPFITSGLSNSQDYTFSGLQFGWSNNQSLFLGFKLDSLTPSGIDENQIVANINDGGQDIFSITLFQIPSIFISEVCFYQMNIQLKCYYVNLTPIWIVFWTDFEKVILGVETNGQYIYDIINLGQAYILNNPSICVGDCTSTFPSLSLIKYNGQILGPVSIILDITFPHELIQDLFNLSGDQTTLISFYDSLHVTKISTNHFAKNIFLGNPSTVSNTLTFHYSQLHPLKGFLITNIVSADHNDISQGKLLTISMSILILTKNFEISQFFKYLFGSLSITYSLFYFEAKDRFGIRICINISCKITNHSTLLFNQPNQLTIIQRDLNPEQNEIIFEYDVVCNFRREKIRLTFLVLFRFDLIFQIKIPLGLAQMMINNIRLLVGSDFYFDYLPSSPCFIYYYIPNMKCLKAKQDYAIYGDQVVQKDSCDQFSTTTQAVIYNKYTAECIKINLIIPNCKIYSDDLQTCDECEDQNASPQNCFQCKEGYYKNILTNKCQECNPKCETCSQKDICTSCKSVGTSIPSCECILDNQFLDQDYQCQTCSLQCQTCKGNSNNCLTCSNGKINPPACDCDPSLYSQSISKESECMPIICQSQCNECSQNSFNCISCSEGRDKIPQCNCASNYYLEGSQCKQCPSGYYYNEKVSKCTPCNKYCKSCQSKGSACTECFDQLILIDSQCYCSDLSGFAIFEKGGIICDAQMDVKLKLKLKNSIYYLILTFEYELDDINFETENIEDLIFLYISQISTQDYSIKSASISGNLLQLELSFLKSFSSTSGIILFMNTQIFSSTSASKVLHSKYRTVPFLFNIGPLLFSDNKWNQNQFLSNVSETLKDKDSQFFNFMRYFQIVFYLLNTLQPCIIFLMVAIVIPPNLYQFLQVIALFIFPEVADYSVDPDTDSYNILKIHLQEGQEVNLNRSHIFRRFGFNNCMITNITVPILETLIWPLLLLAMITWRQISLQSQSITKSVQAQAFILKKISSNCEVGLLIVSTSVLNQFLNIDQSQYLNRNSLYLSIIIIILLLYFNIDNFKNLHPDAIERNGGYQKNNLYLSLVEKLKFQENPQTIRIFFFFQVIRKYMISFFIVFLENYPLLVCLNCSILFFFSLILTAKLRPYKSMWGNISKIFGEASLFSVWIIYLVVFLPFQNVISEVKEIPEEKEYNFLVFGNISIIILSIFNIFYLIEFIWDYIIKKIFSLLKKSPAPEAESTQNDFLPDLMEIDYTKYNQTYIKFSKKVNYKVKKRLQNQNKTTDEA